MVMVMAMAMGVIPSTFSTETPTSRLSNELILQKNSIDHPQLYPSPKIWFAGRCVLYMRGWRSSPSPSPSPSPFLSVGASAVVLVPFYCSDCIGRTSGSCHGVYDTVFYTVLGPDTSSSSSRSPFISLGWQNTTGLPWAPILGSGSSTRIFEDCTYDNAAYCILRTWTQRGQLFEHRASKPRYKLM